MDMTATIFIAVGAIIAALIAGSMSFVNIVIAKDHTISKFRQKWIDSLREDVSKFFSIVEAVSSRWDFLKRRAPGGVVLSAEQAKFVESIYADLQEMANTHRRIQLRLNPTEHQVLVDHLNKIHEMFGERELPNLEHIGTHVKSAVQEAESVLKREWKRVKRGELTFIITKYGALLVFVLLLCVAFAYGADWVTVEFDLPFGAATE
jgi:predicted RND superfamily exporter protein